MIPSKFQLRLAEMEQQFVGKSGDEFDEGCEKAKVLLLEGLTLDEHVVRAFRDWLETENGTLYKYWIIHSYFKTTSQNETVPSLRQNNEV